MSYLDYNQGITCEQCGSPDWQYQLFSVGEEYYCPDCDIVFAFPVEAEVPPRIEMLRTEEGLGNLHEEIKELHKEAKELYKEARSALVDLYQADGPDEFPRGYFEHQANEVRLQQIREMNEYEILELLDSSVGYHEDRAEVAEQDSREWRETAVNAQTQVNQLRTFLEHVIADARRLLDSTEMETP